MADTRTRYDLTQNVWTEIINGGTAATIYNADPGAVYYSMLFDDDTSDPSTLAAADLETKEEMFLQSRKEEFTYPSAAYLWVMASERPGSIIVTE